MQTPSGNTIYYGNESADGGILDVDDCVSTCLNPEGPHVENVVFAGDPLVGTYTYWADNFDCEGPVEYTIDVYRGGLREGGITDVLPDCGSADPLTFELE